MTREQSVIEYRKIKALNQSSLVLFDEDPIQFYKENVLGQPRKDRSTTATLIGDLTDFYLLECRADDLVFDQRFSEKFIRFDGVKSSAQVFVLADELFEIAKSNISDNVVTGDFKTMFREAFHKARGKGKYSDKDEEKAFAKAIKEFAETGSTYYKSRLEAIDKDMVDDYVVEISKRVSNQMLTDSNVSWIFRGNDDIEYLTKFPIEFQYKGFDCKMEADAIHIDHEKKEIQPFDLKVNYDNEIFDFNYLKRSYYLQAGFYRLGTQLWSQANKLEDYTVKPMKFIVGDSSINARRPLIYITDNAMWAESMDGFTYNGKKYRGVNELMDELSWSQENGIWTISKENFENKSVVKMKPYGKHNTEVSQ